jgi:hypothetical protein
VDYEKAITRIYEHLEEDRVESAVMGCLRIARATKDYLSAAIFLRELYPNKSEVARALYDDIAPLKEEVRKFVFDTSLNRWLDLHTIEMATATEDLRKSEGDRRNVLMVAAGELESELQQWERAITDLTLPANIGGVDAAAFTDRFIASKTEMRMRIRAIHSIKSRIKTRCLNFTIQLERQLGSQRQNQGFLEGVQNDVNNFFKARSDDVFTKLQKAAQLTTSNEGEDSALLLTEVRRALKAAADHFYPPISGLVKCRDGIERKLDDERYVNRLHEFLAVQVGRSTSKELLQEELDHLTAFLRRLNGIASKGVHATVTLAEAKQGLIGLYFFLFNLCQHLTHKTEEHISNVR